MKKLLLLVVSIVLMVAGLNAQNNRTATPATQKATTDTVAPAKSSAATTTAPTTKIASAKEVAEAPDVILGKGNYFTGEVLVMAQSKVFLTGQDNIFVWVRDGKAVEIKMIKPSVYEGLIQSEKGYKVYDRWPLILKIGNEEFLVYYFATSGGGYYGLPNGTIQKEKKMKQSGVIRSQWLSDKEGVKEINSLKKLIEAMDARSED